MPGKREACILAFAAAVTAGHKAKDAVLTLLPGLKGGGAKCRSNRLQIIRKPQIIADVDHAVLGSGVGVINHAIRKRAKRSSVCLKVMLPPTELPIVAADRNERGF